VIPPDEARLPGLAVPAGRWQRMDDGSIVVVYASAEEMEVCREATRVFVKVTSAQFLFC